LREGRGGAGEGRGGEGKSQRWRTWLRHCATSRHVTGLNPDRGTGVFHWPQPTGSTVSLGSTQPLTEMSARDISCEAKTAGA
jgi:hypothetical protein